MSAKDVKYNFIFYKKTEKESSLFDYLPYSIEDNINTESIEGNNFTTNDFSQKATFFNPCGILTSSFPEKEILIEVGDFIALE